MSKAKTLAVRLQRSVATPSATFILELALETSPHDETELNARFEAARQLYNACLDEAKRRLELLRQSKGFQEARKMPKTVNGKINKERTEAFKALTRKASLAHGTAAKFGFSEYALHLYATKIRNSWISNHIDSTTAQKLATLFRKPSKAPGVGERSEQSVQSSSAHRLRSS